MRHVVELIICLVITVVCVRTFVIEGYMISTGSMAPSLLGYHKHVVCPLCKTGFELGVAFDKSVDGRQIAAAASPDQHDSCRCPNCGVDGIDVTRVPRTQGDQLLVFKNAYSSRRPHRWEVVVFRNPADPGEAYVKRVIGLPGERVLVQDGDIFINGQRQSKPLEEILATELTVYDDTHRPGDAGWQPRWLLSAGWQDGPNGFACETTTTWATVRYQHWLRTGGQHQTTTTVPQDALISARRLFEDGEGFPFVVQDRIEFDAAASTITCSGVMTDDLRELLLGASADPDWQTAISQLAVNSHLAPISDNYGYNRGQSANPVRDIGFELVLSGADGAGQFAMQLDTSAGPCNVVFDIGAGEAVLFGPSGREIDRATLEAAWAQEATLGLRHVDSRLLVTINNRAIFAPLDLSAQDRSIALGTSPLGFAARGAALQVREVRVLRDIHYTPGRAVNGVRQEFELSDEQYFVLGDNSPVSSDSRNWTNGAISTSHLIGKPMIVHLPSSLRALRFAGTDYLIRLPDYSRIRYVR